MQARQWIAMSTPAPVRLQYQQKTASPESATAYLRIAFYMPALGAVCHDPNSRLTYSPAHRETRTQEASNCLAIMRKLLNAIHAMLEPNTLHSRRFYTPTGQLPIKPTLCITHNFLLIAT